MNPEDADDDFDFDAEVQEWDDEMLDLYWDESEARAVVRDLGITSERGA
jgi:hypothetical protein